MGSRLRSIVSRANSLPVEIATCAQGSARKALLLDSEVSCRDALSEGEMDTDGVPEIPKRPEEMAFRRVQDKRRFRNELDILGKRIRKLCETRRAKIGERHGQRLDPLARQSLVRQALLEELRRGLGAPGTSFERHPPKGRQRVESDEVGEVYSNQRPFRADEAGNLWDIPDRGVELGFEPPSRHDGTSDRARRAVRDATCRASDDNEQGHLADREVPRDDDSAAEKEAEEERRKALDGAEEEVEEEQEGYHAKRMRDGGGRVFHERLDTLREAFLHIPRDVGKGPEVLRYALDLIASDNGEDSSGTGSLSSEHHLSVTEPRGDVEEPGVYEVGDGEDDWPPEGSEQLEHLGEEERAMLEQLLSERRGMVPQQVAENDGDEDDAADAEVWNRTMAARVPGRTHSARSI